MSWLVQAAILGPNMNEYEQTKWNGKLKLELDCWFLKPHTNKKKICNEKDIERRHVCNKCTSRNTSTGNNCSNNFPPCEQNFMFHWRFNDTLKLRGAKAGQSLRQLCGTWTDFGISNEPRAASIRNCLQSLGSILLSKKSFQNLPGV